jgi:hypothetical protein
MSRSHDALGHANEINEPFGPAEVPKDAKAGKWIEALTTQRLAACASRDALDRRARRGRCLDHHRSAARHRRYPHCRHYCERSAATSAYVGAHCIEKVALASLWRSNAGGRQRNRGAQSVAPQVSSRSPGKWASGRRWCGGRAGTADARQRDPTLRPDGCAQGAVAGRSGRRPKRRSRSSRSGLGALEGRR